MSQQGLLFSRLRLKLLSLLFATVLWLFVVLETGDEREFLAQVRLVNLRPGLTATTGPLQVRVRLGGARTLLLRQLIIGLKGELSLADYVVGEFRVGRFEQYLNVVPGLRVLSVAPENSQVVITQKK